MTDLECEHEEFEAYVDVNRLSNSDEELAKGEVSHFVADLMIRCVECRKPFGFRCLDIGLLPDRPTVSPDTFELRVPLISPAEAELNSKDEEE